MFPKQGGRVIPKLNVKFWWTLFIALKTRLFFAKSDIFIPKCTEFGGAGVPTVYELFLKK